MLIFAYALEYSQWDNKHDTCKHPVFNVLKRPFVKHMLQKILVLLQGFCWQKKEIDVTGLLNKHGFA